MKRDTSIKELKELVNKVNDNSLVHFAYDNHFYFIKDFIKEYGNRRIERIDKEHEGYIITVYKK